MAEIANLLVDAIPGFFAAGGAYAAVRVHLSYLRRGYDDHEIRLRALEHLEVATACRSRHPRPTA